MVLESLTLDWQEARPQSVAPPFPSYVLSIFPDFLSCLWTSHSNRNRDIVTVERKEPGSDFPLVYWKKEKLGLKASQVVDKMRTVTAE